MKKSRRASRIFFSPAPKGGQTRPQIRTFFKNGTPKKFARYLSNKNFLYNATFGRVVLYCGLFKLMLSSSFYILESEKIFSVHRRDRLPSFAKYFQFPVQNFFFEIFLTFIIGRKLSSG